MSLVETDDTHFESFMYHHHKHNMHLSYPHSHPSLSQPSRLVDGFGFENLSDKLDWVDCFEIFAGLQAQQLLTYLFLIWVFFAWNCEQFSLNIVPNILNNNVKTLWNACVGMKMAKFTFQMNFELTRSAPPNLTRSAPRRHFQNSIQN